MQRIFFLLTTLALISCAEQRVNGPNTSPKEKRPILSSYDISPNYNPALVKCIQRCQEVNSEQSDAGLDRLRRCGCFCHKAHNGPPAVHQKFCGEFLQGLISASNRDTIRDLNV